MPLFICLFAICRHAAVVAAADMMPTPAAEAADTFAMPLRHYAAYA